jgi:hypothetical protein
MTSPMAGPSTLLRTGNNRDRLDRFLLPLVVCSYFTTSALIVNGLSLLEYLWQPITGTQYPTYAWQAEILWGGATRCREHLSESFSLLPLDDLGPVK